VLATYHFSYLFIFLSSRNERESEHRPSTSRDTVSKRESMKNRSGVAPIASINMFQAAG